MNSELYLQCSRLLCSYYARWQVFILYFTFIYYVTTVLLQISMKTVHTMSKSLQIKVDNGTQIACICPQVACNLLCGDWSPHGSPRSVYLMKNIKMSNFAPCGPIFKIRNSKLVYSKSYKQITDYIFSITSTFRLLLCYFVHFYTQRSRILKIQHCCPTVQYEA